MKELSLKRRLFRFLLIPIFLGFIMIGVFSYYSAFHEGDEIYDAEMARLAVALHTLAMGDLDEERTMIVRNQLDNVGYQKYVSFRVWKNGRLVLQSENAQDFGPITQTAGFTKREINGKMWLFYVYPLHDVIVETAEENEVRLDLIRHIMAGIFLPMIAVIPLTGLFIWIGLNQGLAPVRELSNAVRKSDPHKLEPLVISTVPKELTNVVDEINSLIRRVGDAIRVEKNFTNYAAHEMRTPIAALKTQVQVILRTPSQEKQKELIQELFTTVTRTQRLVEQLLVFARVQNAQVTFTEVPLSSLLLDVMRDYAPQALTKNIEIDHDIAEGLKLNSQEELLRTLISNLIDNSIKYTPADGKVKVQAFKKGNQVEVIVSDNGVGIPAELRSTIFDPFYRMNTVEVGGAGLGLSIAKWISELLHAKISVSEGLEGKGTSFNVSFN